MRRRRAELVEQVDDGEHRERRRRRPAPGRAPAAAGALARAPAAHEHDRQHRQRGDQDDPLHGVDRVGRPGLSHDHQRVVAARPVAEARRSSGTSATAPRAGSSRRQRADQRAVDRVSSRHEREAGEQERERQQPQVAEPDPARQRRPAPPTGAAAATTNQTSPITTISAPTRFSGRRPADDAAGQERPADEQRQHRLVRERIAEVRRRRSPRHRSPTRPRSADGGSGRGAARPRDEAR